MQSFWDSLPTPFFCLAPMEDVTDVAFRALIAEYKPADVTWTEFTSADGLVRAHETGRRSLLKKLEFGERERPMIAQLFSAHEEYMEQASALCAMRGFDGIDINMGCPDKKVEKQGCGSAMIKNPDKARAIIRAVKRGIASTGKNLSVSVKTRVGYKSDDELEPWLRVLLEEGIDALTVHARTRNDLSKVPARWSLVTRAVALRNTLGVRTKIIGNGDAQSLAHGRELARETGCDGIMLGRAIFGNPALFAEVILTPTEKIHALMRLIELWQTHMQGVGNFAVLKKHFASFVSDFDHAKDLRNELMHTNDPEAARVILNKHL